MSFSEEDLKHFCDHEKELVGKLHAHQEQHKALLAELNEQISAGDADAQARVTESQKAIDGLACEIQCIIDSHKKDNCTEEHKDETDHSHHHHHHDHEHAHDHQDHDHPHDHDHHHDHEHHHHEHEHHDHEHHDHEHHDHEHHEHHDHEHHDHAHEHSENCEHKQE
ncbi:UNKNOWN [Stylonychia lemnae]|uniref:Uncharacterized protein n=1 Tax=Stylonychia lemnae TaxID=5949 RepID=A0A078B1C6_STYLE|nr:UNKNOWN [Stylonychia lemnae]|eukprot:CDW88126.1 UNKNOWN [Stylonychia lemnae]